MSDASSDTSGVRFPPPLIYAGGFAAGYGAHRLLPIRLWPDPTAVEGRLGWGLLVAGVLLAISAAYLFRRAGTTPNPSKPSSALVIRGPYRFTRNPMYVGMTTLYLGGTLLLNDAWPFAFLPVVLALLQRYVIAREEAYLERKFEDEYRAYKARVRRWI
jgi:protein-S-isoprenylcysteine O-methyltransferase Ste14